MSIKLVSDTILLFFQKIQKPSKNKKQKSRKPKLTTNFGTFVTAVRTIVEPVAALPICVATSTSFTPILDFSKNKKKCKNIKKSLRVDVN